MYGVVAESGMQGASITEIAEAAGIARGALHYFFASKDEITSSLMRRLGERYLQQLGAWLDARIARSHDPAVKARLVADCARWHFKGDADDALRRMTVWIDFWGQAASGSDIREVVVEIQEAARRVLQRALVAQRPELAGVDDEAMRAHAAALLALVEGGLMQWRFAAGSTKTPLARDAVGDAVAAAAGAFALTISRPLATDRNADRKEAA